MTVVSKDKSGVTVVDYDLLDSTNICVNRRIKYVTDTERWNRADKWQRPQETLDLGTGDCEDYAILKAHMLVNAGVPVGIIKLYLVRTRNGTSHMVLAVPTQVKTGILWWRNLQTKIVLLDNMWDSLYTLKESGHTIIKRYNTERYI